MRSLGVRNLIAYCHSYCCCRRFGADRAIFPLVEN
jgi:hypothetical protein